MLLQNNNFYNFIGAMDIRSKKKSKKRIMFFLIIVILLILILEIKWFWSQKNEASTMSWEIFVESDSATHTEWSKMRFVGNLQIDNNFPLYTHSIIWWDSKVFLKSSIINLNQYTWETEIAGNIIEFYKWIPIIDVSAVKFNKQWLLIKWNSYLFVKDLLYLDFNDQKLLSATKSWSNIIVYFDNNYLFEIERFACSKVIKDKDCNDIMQWYIREQKEFFNSYRWYSFYKWTEKTRTLFDRSNSFGYLIKIDDDNTLLDISNMIRIVNKDFVINNKRDLIIEKCNEYWENIKQTNNSKMWFNDPYYIVINVDWTTDQKKKFDCEVTFDLRDEWNISEVDFRLD